MLQANALLITEYKMSDADEEFIKEIKPPGKLMGAIVRAAQLYNRTMLLVSDCLTICELQQQTVVQFCAHQWPLNNQHFYRADTVKTEKSIFNARLSHGFVNDNNFCSRMIIITLDCGCICWFRGLLQCIRAFSIRVIAEIAENGNKRFTCDVRTCHRK